MSLYLEWLNKDIKYLNSVRQLGPTIPMPNLYVFFFQKYACKFFYNNKIYEEEILQPIEILAIEHVGPLHQKLFTNVNVNKMYSKNNFCDIRISIAHFGDNIKVKKRRRISYIEKYYIGND